MSGAKQGRVGYRGHQKGIKKGEWDEVRSERTEYSRMSLQDIRFNLEDPTITRPKCDIGIRILVGDFVISILG